MNLIAIICWLHKFHFISFSIENGMLHILDRNRRIKDRPEKFQDTKERFDIILTCEERCYDLVVANFEAMENTTEQPVHVINIDIVSTDDFQENLSQI